MRRILRAVWRWMDFKFSWLRLAGTIVLVLACAVTWKFCSEDRHKYDHKLQTPVTVTMVIKER